MKQVRETLGQRIVRVVANGPLTIRQIADELDAGDDTIRVTLQHLEIKGVMRRAGFGARRCGNGNAPYLWEAA